VELQLIVAAAAIFIGLAIMLAGARLLGTGDYGRTSRFRRRSEAFTTSGTFFVVIGALMLFLAVRMIAEVQHERLMKVSPTSLLYRDAHAR
jgi:hypothetical protein